MAAIFTLPSDISLEGFQKLSKSAGAPTTTDFELVRYLHEKEAGLSHTVVTLLTLRQSACDTAKDRARVERVLGFYHGYAGGGVWQDGTFIVDGLNSGEESNIVVKHWPFNDLDDDSQVGKLDRAVLHALWRLAFDYIEIDDDRCAPCWTDAGRRLIEVNRDKAEVGDRCYYDANFHPSLLRAISQVWGSFLRFA